MITPGVCVLSTRGVMLDMIHEILCVGCPACVRTLVHFSAPVPKISAQSAQARSMIEVNDNYYKYLVKDK